ncbi:MAG: hypothetical protein ACK4YQ_05885 [Phenylobacterium sp.]|uniref:hypothetical protein n=1 Tax=Phenylobacterium sp. TaxID=1871053 RepID=UPI00391A6805
MQVAAAEAQESMVHSPALLTALAREMDFAGALCGQLEMLVSRLIEESEGDKQLVMSEAQTVDALTQHLSALASFIRGLLEDGLMTEGAYKLGAGLERIPLASLANRIATEVYKAPIDEMIAAEVAGELDLF